MTGIRKHLIHESRYSAEVEVTYDDGETPWGPTVAKADVFKTDRVRLALRRGDIKSAVKDAKVFELLPLAGEISLLLQSSQRPATFMCSEGVGPEKD